MGQVRRQLLQAARKITIDFQTLKDRLSVTATDIKNLCPDAASWKLKPEQRRSLVAARAVWYTMDKLVQAAFPPPEAPLPGPLAALLGGVTIPSNQGSMDRTDGKMWAAWLEIIQQEIFKAEVSMEMVTWFRKRCCGEGIKGAPALSQWREVVCVLFEELCREEL